MINICRTAVGSIDEVVIEHCDLEDATRSSTLKTIYSIFDTDLPEVSITCFVTCVISTHTWKIAAKRA